VIVRWYCVIHTVPRDDDRGNLAQPRWRVVGMDSLEQVTSVSAHLHGQLGALVLALRKPIRVGSGAIPLHPLGIDVGGQPVRGGCRQRFQSCSQRLGEKLQAVHRTHRREHMGASQCAADLRP
jgi:hypothetical protein